MLTSEAVQEWVNYLFELKRKAKLVTDEDCTLTLLEHCIHLY